MSKKILSSCIALLFLSGCSLIPEYQQPALPVTQSWPAGVSSPQGFDAQNEAVVADIGWREFFRDESLNKLIETALANNRDLRIAALNVETMQAQYRIQRANQLPTINAAGQGTSQYMPLDLGGASPNITRAYTVGLSFNAFELDFFGRIRSLKAQALEQYLATDEARRSAQTLLVSQLASTYLNLLADYEHLQLAQSTLASQTKSYQLVQKSFSAGVVSELSVRQAQTSVESARLDVARYTSIVAQDENMLRQLVGADIPAELLAPRSLEAVPMRRNLPVGLSSEILLQRPDIRQAEHSLKAANANIGAARAAFFPTIALTASGGTGSSELSQLFKAGQSMWSFAPQISLPIFDFGRNSALLDVAELQRDIGIATYEKAIQAAFTEVANALADRNTLEEQLTAQEALTEASAVSYRLSSARFTHGVSSYLDVLDAQRSLYAAEQNRITTRLAQKSNLISLYKALGGGWTDKLLP